MSNHDLLVKLQQKVQEKPSSEIECSREGSNVSISEKKPPKQLEEKIITSGMISTVSGATLLGAVVGGIVGAAVAGVIGYTLTAKKL